MSRARRASSAPVGDEKLKGVISTDTTKDPTDPAWAERSGGEGLSRLGREIHAGSDRESTPSSPGGYITAQVMVEVLKRCGDNLTRANIMKVATSIKNLSFPLLLPGISFNTSPDNLFPLHVTQLKRYNGSRWELVGKPISE